MIFFITRSVTIATVNSQAPEDFIHTQSKGLS